ncbi:MAG TPA: M20/M25/M40 family metallo-hydrolase [Labilithrix sp.]|nr:M20/M25/M40 family metallo-hydrolase [Labilithrix sp.]
MAGWWRRRSRRAKGRLIFYPGLAALVGGFLAYAMVMPGRSHRGPLPALAPEGEALAARLRTDVTLLVGEDVERSQRAPGTLERTATLLASALREDGLAVQRLPYASDAVTVVNVEAVLDGGARAREIVVFGAHYDTAAAAPGADDNASGVAALLAIARAVTQARLAPARTLRFVAFVNEEPPYFWNAEMGSLVYAKACKARGDDVVAMLSLETLGYYRDAPGSQKYPPIVSWFYPDRGDFVAFVGNLGSRGLVHDAIRTFRGAAAFPSEGAALPSFVTGVGWSDQWSFWQVGYPAVMVTDTAPFRNPNYHQPSDKPETLDYPRLARVTEGLVAVVKKLAE